MKKLIIFLGAVIITAFFILQDSNKSNKSLPKLSSINEEPKDPTLKKKTHLLNESKNSPSAPLKHNENLKHELLDLFDLCRYNKGTEGYLQNSSKLNLLKALEINTSGSKESWANFTYFENKKERRVRVENNLDYDSPHFLFTTYSVDSQGYPILEKKETITSFNTIKELLKSKNLHDKKIIISSGKTHFNSPEGLYGSFLTINNMIQELTLTNSDNQVLICKKKNKANTVSCGCIQNNS